jgi:VanZ like family.
MLWLDKVPCHNVFRAFDVRCVTWMSGCNVILFFLYGVLLLLMSSFKSAGMYLQYIGGIEVWLGGDKLMHLYLAIVLAWLALPVARCVKYKGKSLSVVSLFVFLLVCLLLDELHQAGVVSRYFDWRDTLFGGLGLIAGLVLRLSIEPLTCRE